jgi:hypothetical protein
MSSTISLKTEGTELPGAGMIFIVLLSEDAV